MKHFPLIGRSFAVPVYLIIVSNIAFDMESLPSNTRGSHKITLI